MSYESIKAILNASTCDSFVGLKEDAWFDAKSAPYNLNSALDRYELAKDVTAFANGSGGFIVVGLATTPVEEERTEVVTALAPCAPADFRPQSYVSVIENYTHPSMNGL